MYQLSLLALALLSTFAFSVPLPQQNPVSNALTGSASLADNIPMGEELSQGSRGANDVFLAGINSVNKIVDSSKGLSGTPDGSLPVPGAAALPPVAPSTPPLYKQKRQLPPPLNALPPIPIIGDALGLTPKPPTKPPAVPAKPPARPSGEAPPSGQAPPIDAQGQTPAPSDQGPPPEKEKEKTPEEIDAEFRALNQELRAEPPNQPPVEDDRRPVQQIQDELRPEGQQQLAPQQQQQQQVTPQEQDSQQQQQQERPAETQQTGPTPKEIAPDPKIEVVEAVEQEEEEEESLPGPRKQPTKKKKVIKKKKPAAKKPVAKKPAPKKASVQQAAAPAAPKEAHPATAPGKEQPAAAVAPPLPATKETDPYAKKKDEKVFSLPLLGTKHKHKRQLPESAIKPATSSLSMATDVLATAQGLTRRIKRALHIEKRQNAAATPAPLDMAQQSLAFAQGVVAMWSPAPAAPGVPSAAAAPAPAPVKRDHREPEHHRKNRDGEWGHDDLDRDEHRRGHDRIWEDDERSEHRWNDRDHDRDDDNHDHGNRDGDGDGDAAFWDKRSPHKHQNGRHRNDKNRNVHEKDRKKEDQDTHDRDRDHRGQKVDWDSLVFPRTSISSVIKARSVEFEHPTVRKYKRDPFGVEDYRHEELPQSFATAMFQRMTENRVKSDVRKMVEKLGFAGSFEGRGGRARDFEGRGGRSKGEMEYESKGGRGGFWKRMLSSLEW